MYPLPPAANPLVAGVDCPWLPPISLRREAVSQAVPVVRQGAQGAGSSLPVAPAGADASKLARNKKLEAASRSKALAASLLSRLPLQARTIMEA